MQLEIVTCKRYPIRFYTRPETSDIKAIREVVEQNVYQKPRKGFVVAPGERWVDFGGNIGAFAVLAGHLGAARVDAYEADPQSFGILKANIELNGLQDRVFAHNYAVVADNQKKAWLSVSEKNKNFWRNSIVKQWRGSKMVQVDCLNFRDAVDLDQCVKMDIEGAEMPILEAWPFAVPKMVFEWSFDIDPDCDRWRAAMAHLSLFFSRMEHPKIADEVKRWPSEWFPAAMNVFCRI